MNEGFFSRRLEVIVEAMLAEGVLTRSIGNFISRYSWLY